MRLAEVVLRQLPPQIQRTCMRSKRTIPKTTKHAASIKAITIASFSLRRVLIARKTIQKEKDCCDDAVREKRIGVPRIGWDGRY